MTEQPTRIVCLCGSTRFAATFNKVAEQFTLAGWIVVRPEVVTYSTATDPQIHDPKVKARLDELHLRKIDLADLVYVLNIGSYIGPSTRNEITYANSISKPVRYHGLMTSQRALESRIKRYAVSP